MVRKKVTRYGKHRYSKLGLRRKKKQGYKKQRGRDNKVRLNMKGHIKNIRIGSRSAKKDRGLVNGMERVVVKSVEDLKKLKSGEIGVVARVGDKRRMEIAEYAKEKKIELYNLDVDKFLKEIKEKRAEVREKRLDKAKNKKARDKKAKEKEEKDKKEAEEKEKKKDEGKLEDKIDGGEKKKDKKVEKVEEKEKVKKDEVGEKKDSSERDGDDVKKSSEGEKDKVESKSKEEGK